MVLTVAMEKNAPCNDNEPLTWTPLSAATKSALAKLHRDPCKDQRQNEHEQQDRTEHAKGDALTKGSIRLCGWMNRNCAGYCPHHRACESGPVDCAQWPGRSSLW